jgi:hypothetical protein
MWLGVYLAHATALLQKQDEVSTNLLCIQFAITAEQRHLAQ